MIDGVPTSSLLLNPEIVRSLSVIREGGGEPSRLRTTTREREILEKV